MREPVDLEDFNVGERVHTPSRTITTPDLPLFSVLSGSRPAPAVRLWMRPPLS